MIIWTLVAVVMMGVGVFVSLIQPPQSIALLRAKQQSEAKSETKIEVAGDRQPASNDPQFSALDIDDKGTQAVDFNIPCEGNGRFSRNVAQVRLTGKICGKSHSRLNDELENAIESSEIRNVTNGFSATVFYPKTNAFTTDYITLASGKNLIRIQHILKSGAKVRRDFVIERQ
jgi:hypothetical protein